MGTGSNNTNKLSPQEHDRQRSARVDVQIIQINLVLKNLYSPCMSLASVQIIQINLVLKNRSFKLLARFVFK